MLSIESSDLIYGPKSRLFLNQKTELQQASIARKILSVRIYPSIRVATESYLLQCLFRVAAVNLRFESMQFSMSFIIILPGKI